MSASHRSIGRTIAGLYGMQLSIDGGRRWNRRGAPSVHT